MPVTLKLTMQCFLRQIFTATSLKKGVCNVYSDERSREMLDDKQDNLLKTNDRNILLLERET